jgi:hypothetical protein
MHDRRNKCRACAFGAYYRRLTPAESELPVDDPPTAPDPIDHSAVFRCKFAANSCKGAFDAAS